MRFPFKLSALLALLLLAISLVGGTGVGAQDDGSDGVQPEDLDGIQHGVSRTWSIDYSAMMSQMATPGAEMTLPSGIVGIGVVILEFDNDGNAESAYGKLSEEIQAEGSFPEDAEVTEVDLGLGDDSIAYSGIDDLDGQATEDVFALARQGSHVYVTYASGVDAEVQPVLHDITQHVIEAEGSGEGQFNTDGASTGGLWDKFPAADDELVAGLIPYDTVIYPVPEGTPEA